MTHIMHLSHLLYQYVKHSWWPVFRHVCKIAKEWPLASSCLSVHLSAHLPVWNTLAPTGWIFMKFDMIFFENMSKKSTLIKIWRIMCTLREDQYTLLIISHSFLLRMRNVSDKSCRENQNTHFMFSDFFFSNTCHLWDECGKILYSQTGHRWQYSTCTMYAGYLRRQIHTIRNTYCFSTSTMVAWMLLSVMLYLHCLSC